MGSNGEWREGFYYVKGCATYDVATHAKGGTSMFVSTMKQLSALGMVLVFTVPIVIVAEGDLRLVEAMKSHNAALARTLLQENVDVNAAQGDGVTALHWAAHWNDIDLAQLLIGAGADVNAANDLGVTPLSLACVNGSASMVEALLKATADPKVATGTGETVLMTCARTGNSQAVRLLLASGADVQAAETQRGQTALMWAAAENHGDVVEALVSSGAEVQARTRSKGIPSESRSSVGYRRRGMASQGYTPIIFAARTGAMDAARVLLDEGANVNDVAGDGTTPLLVATHEGRWELAHYLLDRGADPNLDGGAGFLPLHWASGSWENGVYGADGARRDDYRRRAGLGPGKLELVKDLLAHGADPDVRMTKMAPQVQDASYLRFFPGSTPFVLAAQGGNSAVMRALLEAGADPLLTDNEGTTALIAAAGYGRNHPYTAATEEGALEAAQMVLDLGNDINAANKHGETPLHAAAYWGKDRMVQFLVDHGAEINAVNKIGQTPLSIAVGVQRPGNEFYSWPNLQVLLKKLGGVVPPAEIEGPIAMFVSDARCPQVRVVLGDPEDFVGGLSPGYTEFVFSADAGTEYTNGTCVDLKVGVRVKVTGMRQSNQVGGDGSIFAEHIEIEQTETEIAEVASASIR